LPKTSISSFAAAAAGAFEKRAGEETGPEMRSQFSSSSAGPLLFPPIYPSTSSFWERAVKIRVPK
jgi:hypothetical protein